MPDTDYDLAWDVVDPREQIPRQLRFQRNWAPLGAREYSTTPPNSSPWSHRPDNGHTLAISRPDVALEHVDTALAGWQHWAKMSHTSTARRAPVANLNAIRARIRDAGLA